MSKREESRKARLAEGFLVYCMGCCKVYKEVPTATYEDGHGGRPLECCKRCNCDLFANLADDTPVKEI